MANMIVRILINKRRWRIWKKIWKRQHFFRISINEIYAISVNEAYGKNGLETKSGGSLVFIETLGGTVAETTGRTCRHYTAIYDCCVTEDGRKKDM